MTCPCGAEPGQDAGGAVPGLNRLLLPAVRVLLDGEHGSVPDGSGDDVGRGGTGWVRETLIAPCPTHGDAMSGHPEFCEARVRRSIRCAKKAKLVADLGMALCRYHEENERKLRTLGIDSRRDG